MSRQALVIGGTKGIGKAVTGKLVREGYTVLATYGNDEKAAGNFLKQTEKVSSGSLFLLQADITREESVGLIMHFIKTNKWKPEVVVFNAGITDRTAFPRIDPGSWQRIFYAHVHFPVFLLQELFPVLKRGSSVLFTGSLMGVHPHALSLSYGVSKTAVHALVKNLVKFCAAKEIRVNGVAPGFVDTDWHRAKSEEMKANIRSKIATGRFSDPEELSGIYWLLITNPSINGEVIVADGGYSFT